MNITPHFTLEELTASETAERNGWDNNPNGYERDNLARLADLLEQVKVVLGGKPIMINSAFRSKQVNDAVGSKDTSQHRTGCAADTADFLGDSGRGGRHHRHLVHADVGAASRRT